MGKEVQGIVRVGNVRYEGKILLETSEIIFRGAEYRAKIAFGEMKSVTAANGELRVATKSGVSIFEVGSAAEKWLETILHPKTRAQKLGVKAGTQVRLVGKFDADFAKELKDNRAEILQAGGSRSAEITFFAADDRRSLMAAAKHAKKMKGAEALWVVYPKGKKKIIEIDRFAFIAENDVLSAGRKAGVKDVKVVGFSATHTALKFVLPVEKR
jgi:hypothetical protein